MDANVFSLKPRESRGKFALTEFCDQSSQRVFIWTEPARISQFTMAPQSLCWHSGVNLEGMTSYKQDIKVGRREAETSGMWAEWLTWETSAPRLEAHSVPPLSDARSGMTCPTLTLHLGPRGDPGPLALSPGLNQRQQRLQKCLYPCIHVKIK